MKREIYKRLILGGASTLTTGVILICYAYNTNNSEAFCLGAVVVLAGMQLAASAHLELMRLKSRSSLWGEYPKNMIGASEIKGYHDDALLR